MDHPRPHTKTTRVHHTGRRPGVSRRRFLRAAGVALSLPWLEAMRPARLLAAEAAAPSGPPRRMLAICNNLGVLAEPFFPTEEGEDYALSPYLAILEEHRRDFTVFSGVSHPNVDGGHPSDISFLTAAPHPASSSFRNTISLDQFVAERIGVLTRFPSLTLAVNTGSRSLSWTGTGVAIPPEEQASAVFNQLFLQGTSAEVQDQVRALDSGRSILDAVSDQAAELARNVGIRDRDRLDQYYSSVRDLERRLQQSRGWETKPKPKVDVPPPVDPTNPAQYMEKVKAMYDLAKLAFETDSTRSITLMLNSVGTPVVTIPGETITDDYHNLSHHGKAPDKLAQLRVLDEWQMRLLAGLFAELKSVREADESLLDRTMVLYGSNLGDANAHSTTNMPILLAGGGFRHGRHLAFDRGQNYPLPNLFVSMLERMGVEEDAFGSSTGTMRGLELS
jgi:BMFP domain-containing protein YqiC